MNDENSPQFLNGKQEASVSIPSPTDAVATAEFHSPSQKVQAELLAAVLQPETEKGRPVSAIPKVLDLMQPKFSMQQADANQLLSQLLQPILSTPETFAEFARQLEVAISLNMKNIDRAFILNERNVCFVQLLFYFQSMYPDQIQQPIRRGLSEFWSSSYNKLGELSAAGVDITKQLITLFGPDDRISSYCIQYLLSTQPPASVRAVLEESKKYFQYLRLDAEANIIFTPEFWKVMEEIGPLKAEFLLEDILSKTSYQVLDVEKVSLWLAINKSFNPGSSDRYGRVILASPEKMNDAYIRRGAVGQQVRITPLFWAEEPRLWKLIADDRVTLEIPAEESDWLKLATILYKDHASLPASSFDSLKKNVLPLTWSSAQEIAEKKRIELARFVAAQEIFPTAFSEGEASIDSMHSLEDKKKFVAYQLLRELGQQPATAAESCIHLSAYLSLIDENANQFSFDGDPLLLLRNYLDPGQGLPRKNPKDKDVSKIPVALTIMVEKGFISAQVLEEVSQPQRALTANEIRRQILAGKFDWSTLKDYQGLSEESDRRRSSRLNRFGQKETDSFQHALAAVAGSSRSKETVSPEDQLVLQVLARLSQKEFIEYEYNEQGLKFLFLNGTRSEIIFSEIESLKEISSLVPIRLEYQFSEWGALESSKSSLTLEEFEQLVLKGQQEFSAEEAHFEFDNYLDAAIEGIPQSIEVRRQQFIDFPLETLYMIIKNPALRESYVAAFPQLDVTKLELETLRPLFDSEHQTETKRLLRDVLVVLSTNQNLSTEFWTTLLVDVIQAKRRDEREFMERLTHRNDELFLTQADFIDLVDLYQRIIGTLPFKTELLHLPQNLDQLKKIVNQINGIDKSSTLQSTLSENPHLLSGCCVLSDQGQLVVNAENLKVFLSQSEKDEYLVIFFRIGEVVAKSEATVVENSLADACQLYYRVAEQIKSNVLQKELSTLLLQYLSEPEQFIRLFESRTNPFKLSIDGFIQLNTPRLGRSFDNRVAECENTGLFVVDGFAAFTDVDYMIFSYQANEMENPFNSIYEFNRFFEENLKQGVFSLSDLFEQSDCFPDSLNYLLTDVSNGSIVVSRLQTLDRNNQLGEYLYKLLKINNDSVLEQLKSLLASNQTQELASKLAFAHQFINHEDWGGIDDAFKQELLGGLWGLVTGSQASFFQENIQIIIQNYEVIVRDQELAVKVIRRIWQSSSATIRKLGHELFRITINSENPFQTLETLEASFLISPRYLPSSAELVLFMKMVYQTIDASELLKYSPLMADLTERQKHFWMSLMLLRNHLYSDSRWFKLYFSQVDSAVPSLQKVLNGETLPAGESEQLANLLKGWKVISELTRMVRSNHLDTSAVLSLTENGTNSLPALVDELLVDLNLQRPADSTTVLNAVAQRFFGFLGINSWENLISAGSQHIEQANERAAQFSDIKQLKNKPVLIKTFKSTFFEDAISEYGFQSKEFFKQESDYTPGDADFYYFAQFNPDEDLKVETMYGDVTAIIVDRGQFLKTEKGSLSPAERRDQIYQATTDHYELFMSGVVGEHHAGVPVGVPISEVEAYLVNSQRIADRLAFVLARKGLSTPIIGPNDEKFYGEAEYQVLRKRFEGVTEFSNDAQPFVSQKSEPYFPRIEEMRVQKFEGENSDFDATQRLNQLVIEEISKTLAELGVPVDNGNSFTINKAQILNTGSTARYSNLPSDTDFDLMILLDQGDWETYAQNLYSALRQRWPASADTSHEELLNNYLLVQLANAEFPGGTKINIDVSIKLKSSYTAPATHDSLDQKYKSLRDELGSSASQETLATVVFTKKLCKHYQAYKDGLRGVGVENWILAHGGNLRLACESVAQAMYGSIDPAVVSSATPIALTEFNRRISLRDVGVNLKNLAHDDFMKNMSDSAYRGMGELVKAVITNQIPVDL